MQARLRNRFALAAAVLTGGAVLGGAMVVEHPAASVAQQAPPPATTQPALPPISEDSVRLAEELSNAFERVAEIIRPSVANISSVRRVRVGGGGGAGQIPQPLLDGPFRDFFGDDFFRRFEAPNQRGREMLQQGQGTAFVVSADGYLLTNNHVVQNADEVVARFADGRTFTATVVGSDPQTDVAVIKIEADNLQPVRLGDSDRLRVGQWVVAAGNPFGLSSTITAGIVSATGRSGVGITDYEDFIQTDAAVNPGNSGGPLVNLRGEVVGINSAIVTRSGGNMGIGFAIPINLARGVMDSLIREGRVVRGYLGVEIQDLDEELARSFGYEGPTGVVVTKIVEGGPAAASGLRVGDIVTGFAGTRVDSVSNLRLRAAATRPGTRVPVEVLRSGRRQTVDLTMGELSSGQAVAVRSEEHGNGNGEAAAETLGLTVQTLTRDVAAQLGLDRTARGVVVRNVERLSVAGRAGLRVGDIILDVQGEPVTDVQTLRRLFTSQDLSEGVRLLVQRGDSRVYVMLRTRS